MKTVIVLGLVMLGLAMQIADGQIQFPQQRIPITGYSQPSNGIYGSYPLRLTVPSGATGITITPLINGTATSKYVITVYKDVSSGEYIALVQFLATGKEAVVYQWY